MNYIVTSLEELSLTREKTKRGDAVFFIGEYILDVNGTDRNGESLHTYRQTVSGIDDVPYVKDGYIHIRTGLCE